MIRTTRFRTGSLFAIVLVAVLGAAGSAAAHEEHEHEFEFEYEHEGCLHGKLEHARLRAASDIAWDETSGRNLRNFPPDRDVDLLHMKLQMRFEDLEDASFTATETLTFVPIGDEVASLTLDAVGLSIDAVRLDGGSIEHFQDDESVTFYFSPALAGDAERRLEITYRCEDPWDGLFFTPSAPDNPAYTAEVHTQGQTESNRHWFICRDFPNERLTTELIVNVPAEYSVSGNGHLVSNLVSGDRAIWHWLQDKPHVAYLVSLVIGKFDVVEIPHARVPMKVWVPVGKGDQVMQTYGRTGEMIDLFERRFGLAYPWDRYDQLVVKSFNAGGMENTTATSMYPTAIFDERALLDADLDRLIAHELAHQWTGDLITCKSWAHIWLNEGWATYGSALWEEQRGGEDAYLDSIRGSFRVARRDRTTNDLPMVSPVYEDAWQTFRRRANPYPKGSSIMHMLRKMLGEDVFWEGVHLYINRHAMGLVETDDFRYALEEVSGQGLEWFFDQWCYRPGSPELEVDVRYQAPSRELVVQVDQVQQIDARTPAFRFTLPIHVETSSGPVVHRVDVTERSTTFRATLDGVPSIVAIDPDLHVLKTISVTKPNALWVEQAQRGPTIAARHEAVKALGEVDTSETVALLTRMIEDTTLRHTLRRTAVTSLRGLASAEARGELLRLARGSIDEARVRSELVKATRDLDRDDVIELLADVADNDVSYKTRVEAIRALAHHEATEYADLVAELVHYESQHQDVRRAALTALADMDDERGLELGVRYGSYGHYDRARTPAIAAVAKLAEHDTDRAVEFLIDLLDDPQSRVRRAAGSGLVTVGDERGLDPLRAIARSHPDPDARERAEGWVEKLEKKVKENAADEDGEG